ncbi:SDR family NAD(P)-dependent oxidoreductase [Planotetraspora sp. GP83]|uniref:SDR family NAD(P)-dependent oxidoreductase n=1 Tax=Planotetraspora sp. GP83 TaxID=3156264 RepID=UPI0035164A84
MTGASSGIGKAVAERLGREGASVVVCHSPSESDTAQGAAVAKALRESGAAAVAAGADISDPGQVRALFDVAEKEFGGLDIFVHSAANTRHGTLADTTDEDFDQIFATNARASFVALRECGLRMREGGRVVVISAGLTLMPRPGTGVYAASKAAADHLVRVAARELAPRDIRVNSVLPGAVNTPALAGVPAELIAREVDATPLGRVGEPEDISNVVAFLASDEARWITGQCIGAGGGMF